LNVFSLIAGILPSHRHRSKPAVLLVVLAMATHGGATAQADPPLPVIPATNFNVTSFGAFGDGVSNNATAIQSAINAAASVGGGTVVVAAVGILTNYLSGPIVMSNNVCLQINGGTKLQMFPMNIWTKISTASTPFISGNNLHDVAISGSGTIDGNAGFSAGSTSNWWGKSGSNNPEATRPQFLNINSTTNLLVQGVTLQNPPMSHFVFKSNDTNVTIQGIVINTVTNSPNTDSEFTCENMLIRSCTITCGDDDLVTSGADITISNCTFNSGHGLSIGSFTTSGMNNLLVSNCTWIGTEYGIHLKSDRGRGGLVQNLTYQDLIMSNVNFVVAIYSYYIEIGAPSHVINVSPFMASTDVVQTVTSTTPIWRNITISNVTASTVGGNGNIAGIFWGLPEMLVSNVILSHVNFTDATNTFCIYNAQGIQIIDSNLATPANTNTLTLYNAAVTVTNSALNTKVVTLTGLAIPPTNNVLAFFNAQAAITDTNLLGPNPDLTLGGSTLTVSNNLNLGGASTLNFGIGTNATKLAIAGNLSVNGTLNITDAGGFTSTTYTLFTYTGALLENGITIGAAPALYNYVINTNAPGQVNLVVTPLLTAFQQWQLQYFYCTNCAPAQPNADPYGKGMSNTNQFLAGFNPTNAAAYLRVISIVEQSVAGNANVVVTYLGPNGDDTYSPGIASRTNVLDYLTGNANGNYTNGGWQDTGQTNILSGGNGSGTVTNMTNTVIPGTLTNRYYRVRVLLP
jgi:polygalacturonase